MHAQTARKHASPLHRVNPDDSVGNVEEAKTRLLRRTLDALRYSTAYAQFCDDIRAVLKTEAAAKEGA